MPRCTNVVVEPRAPESSTGTFLNRAVTNSWALASSLLFCLQGVAPGGQVVASRPPPDVFGFGVMTSTPGFTRSFQSLIPFGLPLRTRNTIVEV